MSAPVQSVVITGGAGDLGRSLCRSFCADGFRVYAADVRPAEPAENLVPVGLDVTDRDAVFALSRRVAAESRPVAWINGAGIFVRGNVSTADPAVWERIIGINLTGTFHGCAAALAMFTELGGGRIVNVGSVAGQAPGGGVHPAYGVSKAGIHQLTRLYAMEGAKKNVLCNAVAPGMLEGEMISRFTPEQRERIYHATPLRRPGTMDEVTAVIRFLCGPAANYMTGAVLPVNGGALMP